MKTCEVIVIGLGAMGSAATYQLAKRKINVLGIDQFTPPHSLGSSHGDTRITRQAIGEGEEYVPLVLRSNKIWREIEQETGKQLLTETGGLIMGIYGNEGVHHSKKQFLETTIHTAEKFKIPHRVLKTEEIRKEFPQFLLYGNEAGYYEYGAGYLRPEDCVEAQLQLAKKYGAELRTDEKVLAVRQQPDGVVTVKTDLETYQASKVILSAGPWVNDFLPSPYHDLFKVYRQVLYWFDPADTFELFTPDKLPVYIWEFGDGSGEYIYGFPAIDGKHGGAKVATEQYTASTNPEHVGLKVGPEEIASMYETHIRNYIKLTGRCIKAKACLYTVTPDANFVIDAHPEYRNVLLASPCSGHGFKHSAAIGEALAQISIDGKSEIDTSSFSLERLHADRRA